jgi:hypothetical protein
LRDFAALPSWREVKISPASKRFRAMPPKTQDRQDWQISQSREQPSQKAPAEKFSAPIDDSFASSFDRECLFACLNKRKSAAAAPIISKIKPRIWRKTYAAF